MDSSKIKAIIIAILAMFAALYLGITAATAQLETVIWVVGCCTLVVCVLLGRRIYLVIPFLSSIALVLPMPGQFSTEFMGQAIFMGFATMLFLMRKLPLRIRFTELEWWMILLAACVGQTFIRNPAGLDILGTETVGAKPYAIFVMSAMTAFVLSSLIINPKDLKIWTYLAMTGSVLNFIVGAVGFFVPTIGNYTAASFTADVGGKEKLGSNATSRISFVKNISQHLSLWVSSRKSPLAAAFHPLWAPLVLLALALAGASGYRAQMILISMIFFIGVCYRGGFRSVVASGTLGAIALALLSVVNLVAPLPMNVQRTLSVLPGTWDQAIVEEADESSDWRVEIWKDALFTDRWIHNKMLGDGLGFSREEFNKIKELEMNQNKNQISRIGLTNQQESYLINGNYHSGPVHTIRTIGYAGFAILLAAMFRLAVHAHRQIRRCRGTEWYSTALFLGIPLIALPIHWTFVIGTFETATLVLTMGIAVVRMMEQNLPLPPYQKPGRYVYTPANRQAVGSSA